MRRNRHEQFILDFAPRQRNNVNKPLCSQQRKVRLGVLYCLSVMWALGVVGRLYFLQITDNSRWVEWAQKQHVSEIELASERGPIVDREGKLLAVSVPAGSVYVRPKLIEDKKEVAAKLAAVLELEKKYVLDRLQENKPFVWLRRQLPRQIADRVSGLNIKGVNYVLEAKRFYPYNNAASTLIGKVGVDGNGLSGVEKIFEKKLHEQNIKTKVVRDAFGNSIQLASNTTSFELPKGEALKLTLDTGIQQIMDEETDLGQRNANARSVTAVMVDAETGEILGMSQSDSPNFNLPASGRPDDMKNLLVEAVFEPGSIFKPLVAAAAIEEGVVSPAEIINCENGKYPFMKHVIKDVHPSGTIPFFDVVVRSSNIGMTKVGIRLGKDRLYEYIRRFGFGEKTNLGLPGETDGILRHVSTWAGVDVATHSFGQGVAVTPLQVARAMAAIANGGKLPTLTMIDDELRPAPRRILSEKTAKTVQEMMFGVVEDEHGTGGKAEIEGVRVAGKTGTAQKARPDGKGYQAGSYVASFVGFTDSSALGISKKLVLAVMVDEPHANSIYGGTLAAPVFKRVMQRTLHLMMTKNELAPANREEGSFIEAYHDEGKKLLTAVSYASEL